jgi:peptide/nickel transport system substrate-binding protein
MGRKLAWVSWIAVFGLLLAVPLAQAGKDTDTLNILHPVELSSVDNYFNTDRLGVVLCHHLWDSLLYRDYKTGEYKPSLATSWKFVDSKTLEFELRQGVKFHNGDEFDADDVVYTLNWVSDPKNGVKTQNNVNWIEKCEKLGKFKVRVKTKKIFPAAPAYIAGVMAIYPHKYYSKVGPEGMAIKPVGTGPYKGVEVIPGKSITLAKNENYFAASPKGQPSIGKLHIRFISEVNTEIAELMSGRADWIWRVPQDQAERLAKMPRITVETADTMRVFFLPFDAANKKGRNSPLNKLKVRQAICYAIDRATIRNTLVKGASRLINSACYPSQFGCTDDVFKYEYNPAKAKKLLAEAGYPNGFEMEYYGWRERPEMEAVMGYLNAVGIKVKIQWMQYAAVREKIRAGEVDMSHNNWGSFSIPDASAFTGNFFGGTADDNARDPEVIKWLKIADTSIDPEVRKKNYKLALERIAEQAYCLPLWSANMNYAFTKDLNFTAQSDEIPRFYNASWK